MSDTKKQTLIEEGTEFDGSIRSRCDVSVSGKIKGKLQAPTLTIMPSGSVQGQVQVQDLNSQGELSGEIDAQSVVLAGKVCDRTVIQAKHLEVKLDQKEKNLQVTFGNCELRVGNPAAQGGGAKMAEETKMGGETNIDRKPSGDKKKVETLL